jgi:hypothetical protein
MRAVIDSGKRCLTAAPSSGWRVYDGNSVSDVNAPTLFVYRAMVRPAQRDEIAKVGVALAQPTPYRFAGEW